MNKPTMNNQPAARIKSRKKDEFTRDDYFQALALFYLSSVAHETWLLTDAMGNREAGDAFSGLHTSLFKQARGLFPLWPHGEGRPQDDFSRWERGQAWLKSEGIVLKTTQQESKA